MPTRKAKVEKMFTVRVTPELWDRALAKKTNPILEALMDYWGVAGHFEFRDYFTDGHGLWIPSRKAKSYLEQFRKFSASDRSPRAVMDATRNISLVPVSLPLQDLYQKEYTVRDHKVQVAQRFIGNQRIKP